MVEFRIRQDGTPVLLEVNGRFWNSLALAIYAGADFPNWQINLATDGTVPANAEYKIGIRCRWLLGDARHLVEVLRGAPREFPGKFPGRASSALEFFRIYPGTYHDNFELTDPLPEVADWLYFFARKVPRMWGPKRDGHGSALFPSRPRAEAAATSSRKVVE